MTHAVVLPSRDQARTCAVATVSGNAVSGDRNVPSRHVWPLTARTAFQSTQTEPGSARYRSRQENSVNTASSPQPRENNPDRCDSHATARSKGCGIGDPLVRSLIEDSRVAEGLAHPDGEEAAPRPVGTEIGRAKRT